MKKFFPRVFNVLSFILALALLMPFSYLGVLIESTGKLAWLSTFFKDFQSLKLTLIPFALCCISVLYLIVSIIDRAAHKEKASKQIAKDIYCPIAYLGILTALAGFVSTLMPYVIRDYEGVATFAFSEKDFFGLGKYILLLLSKIFQTETVTFVGYIGLIYFTVLLVVQVLLLLIFKRKFQKRLFIVKLLALVLFSVFALLSTKGITDQFALQDSFSFVGMFNVVAQKGLMFEKAEYVAFGIYYLIFAATILFIYIVLGISNICKDKKAARLAKAAEEECACEECCSGECACEECTCSEEAPQEGEECAAPQEGEEVQANEVAPVGEEVKKEEDPEEEIVKEISEKASKNPVYEADNLSRLFQYEFGFENVTMVKADGYNEYYVNKEKFLKIYPKNKQMCFRLDLDKAIRLIIEYPLISKDKYEEGFIWFKVDSFTELKQATAIEIVTESYRSVAK